MSGAAAASLRMAGLAIVGTALAACVPQSDGHGAGAGKRSFNANCAGCHGAEGKGGAYPGAPALTGLSAANGGVFPAAHVLAVLDGHGRNPEFSAAMPEFGGSGMGAGPMVDVPGIDGPVPSRAAGVLAYLRTIQQ